MPRVLSLACTQPVLVNVRAVGGPGWRHPRLTPRLIIVAIKWDWYKSKLLPGGGVLFPRNVSCIKIDRGAGRETFCWFY
ncbi:MAG TPA: hypothetical protein DDW41_00340 [Candidatus Andersenbacteria bacterium]|nr:hypothetical protein [Candidatus Andersenbacteria bacterium]